MYRTAEKSDISELVRLRIMQQKEEYPNGTSVDKTAALTEYFTENLGGGLLVCVECIGGRIAATASIVLVESVPMLTDSGRYGYLCNVFTLPEYRRRGISLSLCGHTIKAAREKFGICAVFLDTAMPNAVKLYEKLGFVRRNDFMSLEL